MSVTHRRLSLDVEAAVEEIGRGGVYARPSMSCSAAGFELRLDAVLSYKPHNTFGSHRDASVAQHAPYL